MDKIKKYGQLQTVASYIFACFVLLLLTVNLLLRIFVFHDSIWTLLLNFAAPFGVTAVLWALEQKHEPIGRLLVDILPVYKVVGLLIPALAVVFSILWEPEGEDINYFLTLLAAMSLCAVPYILNDIRKANIAIIAQTVGFVLVAADMENTAAIVSIFFISATILSCPPKSVGSLKDDRRLSIQAILSVATLVLVMVALYFLEFTGIAEAFWVSSLGRPSLGSADVTNRACSYILKEAKFSGSTLNEFLLAGLYGNRYWALILAISGWIGIIPWLLAVILMISSGVAICSTRRGGKHYYRITFLAFICIQTVGYLLTNGGWDTLVFPEISPFLCGRLVENTVFLTMAVSILPLRERLLLTKTAQKGPQETAENPFDILDISSDTYEDDFERILDVLPHTQTGMMQLWDYLRYNDQSSIEGWHFLLEQFDDLTTPEMKKAIWLKINEIFDPDIISILFEIPDEDI